MTAKGVKRAELVKREDKKCPLCSNLLPEKGKKERPNIGRHSKTFHLLCPRCLRLEHRVKHPHFGTQLLRRSQLLEPGFGEEMNEDPVALVFVPVQIRSDIWSITEALLAAREWMDNDIFTIFFFLLAKLRRTCLACLSQTVTTEVKDTSVFSDLHTCHTNTDIFLREYLSLTFRMFNVKETEYAQKMISDLLSDALSSV